LPEENTSAHRLIADIKENGAISLGDYMAEANRAYYASKDPLGTAGDFITAPEISQMFGEIIGIWITDLLMRRGLAPRAISDGPSDITGNQEPAQSPAFRYVELGPGRGTLAKDARRTMAQFGWQPPCHFVETSPVLRAAQQDHHPDAIWHDDVDSLPDDAPLIIIANEFFDALPVEQFVRQSGGWHQNMVVRDRSKFKLVPGERPSDVAPAPAGNAFPNDTILEVSPVSNRVMDALSAKLAQQGGALLIIDYGYRQPGTGSTLQAVQNHMPVHPFDAPGCCDLTAHVNFHALASCAENRLLGVHGPVEQGQWFKSLGIEKRAEILAQQFPQEAQSIHSALHRLTHIDQMGRLFLVMAALSAGWPVPEGFAYGG